MMANLLRYKAIVSVVMISLVGSAFIIFRPHAPTQPIDILPESPAPIVLGEQTVKQTDTSNDTSAKNVQTLIEQAPQVAQNESKTKESVLSSLPYPLSLLSKLHFKSTANSKWKVGDLSLRSNTGTFRLQNDSVDSDTIDNHSIQGEDIASDITLENVTVSGDLTTQGNWNGVSSVLGTISTGVWHGSTIDPAYGGTGLASYTMGDMIYASGATTLSKLADVATGSVLISGGVGVAPNWGTIGASGITADSLDFTEFKDTLTLDASTDILATGTNVLSISNTGTGNSFLVNDDAGDTTPFVINANGQVGIGTTNPQARLAVAGDIYTTGTLEFAHSTTTLSGVIFPEDNVLMKRSSKTQPNTTGILLPLYIYPSSVYTNTDYNTVINLKKKYHDVPLYVILNPASGAGSVVDGNYTVAIQRLHGAGVIVLGYVSSYYTASTTSEVEAGIDNWTTLYPEVDGIFIDEMTNTTGSGEVEYYSTLTRYIHQKGLYPSVGNPGANIGGDYFSNPTADVIVIHENSSYPTEATLLGDYNDGHADYNYNKRAGIVYGNNFNTANATLLKKYLGLIYVTDDVAPNPYDTLSSELATLFEFLSNEYTRQFGNWYVDGNVGIGTITPSQKLDVAGNVNVSSGSAYMYNGVNVITAQTALSNYFFGGAGNLTMTGIQNTANGVQALYSNTAGSSNTANGYQALYSTTGFQNTASGVQSLYFNTTGSQNTALGDENGYNPSNNIAQYRIVDDTYMTLLGYGATKDNASTLTNGTAIGNGAHVLASNQVVLGNDAVTTTLLKGNVGIGDTTPGQKLSVNGTVGLSGLTTGSGNGSLCLTTAGEVQYDAGANCIVSSKRFKNSIASSIAGLDEVLAMRPVTFRYNTGEGDGGKQEQLGFIAEEINKVDPRLVVFDANTAPYSVKYQNLTAVLAKAIQELYDNFQKIVARVTGLEKRLDSQQEEIKALQDRVNSIDGKDTPIPTLTPTPESTPTTTPIPIPTLEPTPTPEPIP